MNSKQKIGLLGALAVVGTEQKTILFMMSKDEEHYLSKIKKLTDFSKIEQIEYVK